MQEVSKSIDKKPLSSADEKPEMDRNPPILNHNSRGRSTGSCNCGRKQAPREDPFAIQAANYDFYQVSIYHFFMQNFLLKRYPHPLGLVNIIKWPFPEKPKAGPKIVWDHIKHLVVIPMWGKKKNWTN